MDFALFLVLATALTGLIWAVDAAWLRSRRLAADGTAAVATDAAHKPGAWPVIVEYARSFFPILLIVLLIRSFLFEPFRIPSASMMPTLLVGDFIFVNKYTYGLRLPVLNTEILDMGSPERGDVVVFRLPSDPSINYIKRLVGLPGDEITYVHSQIFVNGKPVPITTLGPYMGEQPASVLAREQLGSHGHDVLLMAGRPSLEGTFIVPAGHYFFMGDNRDNSRDSRYDGVGMVPEENLVGKAERIWMNWSIPEMPKWGRIGQAIE
ncbi:MAG: signal peptidase I [Gammaproteobacteria bacterium PRO9]|nr:signal peptidase I [Gammaproteobacteria bacterium PRO9]